MLKYKACVNYSNILCEIISKNKKNTLFFILYLFCDKDQGNMDIKV